MQFIAKQSYARALVSAVAAALLSLAFVSGCGGASSQSGQDLSGNKGAHVDDHPQSEDVAACSDDSRACGSHDHGQAKVLVCHIPPGNPAN